MKDSNKHRKLSSLTIGEFLTIFNLRIPDFQSPYRWSKKEARIFLKKILSVFNGEYKIISPSFNMITVYTSDDNPKAERHILDGFQRTTTMILLICVLRDLLLKIGEGTDKAMRLAQSLHHEYVYKIVAYDEKVYKLQFHKRDIDFVKNVILEPFNNKERIELKDYKKISSFFKRDSCKNMLSVYRYMFIEVEKTLKNLSPYQKIRQIEGIIDAFLNGVEIDLKTYIALDQYFLNEAFIDMNQPVVKLHKETEIKGILLNESTNKLERQGVITILERLVDRFDTNSDLDTFIKHRSMALHGEALTKEEIPDSIYKELKNNDINTRDFAEQLDNSAAIYEAYYNPTEGFWKNTTIVNTLNCLVIGRFKQAFPIVLAAREYILNTDLIKELFLFVLKVFMVRALFNLNPNDTEPTVIKACDVLRGEGIASNKSDREKIDIAKQIIKNGILTNNSNINEFISLVDGPINDNNKVSVLLRLIESHITNEEVLFPGPKLVQVEHIAPRVFSNDWEKSFALENNNWLSIVERLGNRVLLDGKRNRQLGNKALYPQKKVIYKTSSFHLTKQASNYEKFQLNEFEFRQKIIVKHISEIFSDIFVENSD